MSKKQINNRLSELFENIKEKEKAIEQPEAKPDPKREKESKKDVKSASFDVKTEALSVSVGSSAAHSTMSLPLRMDTDFWGTLQIVDDTPEREWNREEQLLVQQVTDQLTLALQNASLYQETERRREELELVNRIVTEVSSSLELDKDLEIITKEIAQISQAARVSIAILNEEKNYLVLTADYPKSPKNLGYKFPLEGNTSSQQVLDTLQPLVIHDIQNNPLAEGLKEAMKERGTNSLTIFPLIAGNEAIGTVGLDFEDPFAQLSQNQFNLIQTILLQASTSIETSRFFQQTQESEEELRSLFSAMDDVIFVVDREARYLRIAPTNPSGLVLAPEELLGKRMYDLFPEEMYTLFSEAIAKALDTEETVNIEYPIEVRGKESWFYASLSKLGENQVYWIARDITERKQAELQIQRLGNAVEQSLDGMAIADMDGNLEFVNPAWAKMHGYESTEELLGQPMSIFHSNEQIENEVTPFNEIVEKEGSNQGEVGHKRQDGTTFPTWMTVGILKSVDDAPLALVASAQDITERKRSAEILQRQNEYMAAAAEVGRLVTSTLDLDILFRRAVSLLQEHFGYYHAAIFIIEETGFEATIREATGAAGEEMKKKGHSLTIGSKSVVGTATGTGRPYIVNNVDEAPLHHINPLLPDTKAEAAIPLKIGRRIVGAIDLQATEVGAFTKEDVAILQLLGDQFATAIDNARSYKLAQDAFVEMRELEKLKSQFLANMSHELRTPLNSIIGFSRVILKGIDGPITDLQQQDLTAIYNSGQHLLGLINDILDLSKIEAGKMELTFDEVDIEKLIKSVMSTVLGLIKDKPVRLVDDIEENLPTVRADSMRIRQILINFFSNAAKFTDEGNITVTARKEATGVRISVIDSGPGISPEDQKKLFQAFSQVDASATRATGGSGLGLSISKQLVTMHGGEIGLTSEVGKGSEFFFTLLFFEEETTEDEEIDPADNSPIILAIDDDEKVIDLYKRYLNKQGYRVIALTDPQKAVQRAKELQPYAITLDIMMPGYDGWQVLEDLKSDPETKNFPTIICSLAEDTEKGYALGAADYLVKPILDSDLVNALGKLNDNEKVYNILIIDDDADDLRLLEKIFTEKKEYDITLADNSTKGWEMIINNPPHAVILDLFMPEMDGFQIIESMQTSDELKEIPLIIISGGDLSATEQEKLNAHNLHLLQKGALESEELLATLERSLNHPNKKGNS